MTEANDRAQELFAIIDEIGVLADDITRDNFAVKYESSLIIAALVRVAHAIDGLAAATRETP